MSFIYELRKSNYSCFVTENVNFLPHIHHHIEFAYIVSGLLDVTIENINCIMQAGDFFITFPNQIHAGNTKDNSLILFIIFTADFLSDFRNDFLKYVPQKNLFNLSDLTDISTASLRSIISISEVKGFNYPAEKLIIFKGLLTIILGDLFSKYPLVQCDTTNVSLIQTVLQYINKNFTSEITLDKISHALGINKFYLSRIFSNQLKTSFPEYICSKRLDLSKSLLINTDKSVTEIMYEVGFKSERTFYRSFKEHYGKTPKQIRNTRQ